MIHQRLEVALGNNAYIINAGVYHVGERKVNQTVSTAERNGGHGTISGQLGKFFIVNIGK